MRISDCELRITRPDNPQFEIRNPQYGGVGTVSRPPTAFERRVYAVVKRIKAGEVRSYQWVAARLGQPNASRAVGQALKRNPWPLTVPCHRVIRADGRLGGFAWGLAQKRRLLLAERQSGNTARPT